MDQCLNCQKTLDPAQLFCDNCGQKVHNSKLTVWSLIGEFLAGIFNLENGVYKSLLYLPVPGYLSRKFMDGKRKQFLNPIRFFLVALIIHIAVITDLIPLEQVTLGTAQQLEKIGKSQLKSEFGVIKDSLSQVYNSCDLDTLESIIFSADKFVVDSIAINDPKGDTNVNSFLLRKKYKFDRGDVYDMQIEEFLTHYNAETYWERVFMTQMVRAIRDPTGAIRFGIGNLIWSILFAIILTGFLMKLLYIRRKRFFVEHLIVLFNIHSFAFLVSSIGLYFGFKFIGPENNLDDIAYSLIALFFFLSIKYYYQQGWIKSFIKFTLIGFVYISLLFFMILSVTLVSLFLFK